MNSHGYWLSPPSPRWSQVGGLNEGAAASAAAPFPTEIRPALPLTSLLRFVPSDWPAWPHVRPGNRVPSPRERNLANAKQFVGKVLLMNVSDEKTRSIWMDVTIARAPALDRSERADAAVIGSGIAGLSVAYELAERGRSVIVVDRGKIGSGMTARTTAHLATVLDDNYAELIKSRGLDCAQVLYQSLRASIDRIAEIQTAEHIECDFCRTRRLLDIGSDQPCLGVRR